MLSVTFLRQGIENAEELHFIHGMQIFVPLARILHWRNEPYESGNSFVVRRLSNYVWHEYSFCLEVSCNAIEHCVYKLLATFSNLREYDSVLFLRVIILFLSGCMDNTRVLKHYIVILFPQLPVEEIKSCTECAPLVGSLTVRDELDRVVRQTVMAYINVSSFPSQFIFAPYRLVVQRVENHASVRETKRFKAAWGI